LHRSIDFFHNKTKGNRLEKDAATAKPIRRLGRDDGVADSTSPMADAGELV
jgi:hypothetical protein